MATSSSIPTRVLSVCGELQLPLWYSSPSLVEHVPLTSAFATPPTRAADFDADFRLQIQPGYQPPEEVPGWLTVEEGRLLWEQAADLRVLELGTGLGRSTVCLAQGARQVVTIDRQNQSEEREWCRRYQVHERVVFRQGEIERIAPRLEEYFDLFFVDSEPDEFSVRRAIEAALPLLAADGLLAFHDYPDPGWPGVRRAVDEFADRFGWHRSPWPIFWGSSVNCSPTPHPPSPSFTCRRCRSPATALGLRLIGMRSGRALRPD